MTRSEKMRYRLAHACLGRENHAALVEVRAKRLRSGRTHICWMDSFTGESGPLGMIDYFEVPVIVHRLFLELRQWRERCEGTPAARAKGAGA
jgi:hypothetical protein